MTAVAERDAEQPAEQPGERRYRPRHMARRRGLTAVALVAVFFACLVVAWSFANPPGYTPDEPAHLTKAIGVGRGVWSGAPGQYPVGPGFGPKQLTWINKAARVVHVPANMAPDQLTCALFQEQVTAACIDDVPPPSEPVDRLTYVGTYEPFLYTPPGLAIRAVAHNPSQGVLVGRLAIVAICIPLLALAAAVLAQRRPRVVLAGLLIAATPVAIFLTASLSPAGAEIAASLCLGAAVIRLARAEPGDDAGWAWLAVALGGTVLALARSLGPYFVAANAVVFVLLAGWRTAGRILRAGGRRALGAVALVAMGMAANVTWGVFVQPKPPLDVGAAIRGIGPTAGNLDRVYREAVAVFGWQDVTTTRAVPALWGLLLVGLFGVALYAGTARQRRLLLLLVAGGLVGVFGIAVGVIGPTHFPMFGRYSLPVVMISVLYAGDVVASRWDVVPRRIAPAVFPLATAGVALAQGISFYANARRYAVGSHGPLWFFGRSQWVPRYGGWTPWFVLAAVGLAALVAAGLVRDRSEAESVSPESGVGPAGVVEGALQPSA